MFKKNIVLTSLLLTNIALANNSLMYGAEVTGEGTLDDYSVQKTTNSRDDQGGYVKNYPARQQDGIQHYPDSSFEETDSQYRSSRLKEIEREINRNAAYESALDTVTPYTPEEVEVVLRRQAQVKEVKAKDYSNRAVLNNRTINVKLNGVSQPRVRVGKGFLTSLFITDAQGYPWKVRGVQVGDSGIFAVNNLLGKERSNMFSVISNTHQQTRSSLIFVLEPPRGGDTPVLLNVELLNGEKQLDSQVVLRLNGISQENSSINQRMMSGVSDTYVEWISTNTPPKQAKRLRSTDERVEVFRFNGKVVALSPFNIYFPQSEIVLGNGRNTNYLYQFTDSNATFVRFTDQNGKTITVDIK